MARLDQLATLSEKPGEITRLYLSQEHKQATDLVADWMRDAGMEVEVDDVANVVGRARGSAKGAKTVMIGSHIDTVRNAGRYDGCLGVVMAIEAMAELRRLGRQLPFNVEVIAFGDEEGVRFPRTLNGSHAVAGGLDTDVFDGADARGTSLSEALRSFGCDPTKAFGIARRPADVLAYVEAHIEQGPVLEAENIAIGVVTAISGASRFLVDVKGKAGHSGTLPMTMRRDALAAAAEMVLAIEEVGRNTNGLVATVGQITASPGAINVVPGHVTFSLDVRSPMDRTRRTGLQEIDRRLRAIARRRQVSVKLNEFYNEKALACDQRLIHQLTAAAEALRVPTIGLPSGAGHDGLAISRLCPVGMLFVRCKGGVSHHPDEAVKADDVEIATRVLLEFLGKVAPTGRSLA